MTGNKSKALRNISKQPQDQLKVTAGRGISKPSHNNIRRSARLVKKLQASIPTSDPPQELQKKSTSRKRSLESSDLNNNADLPIKRQKPASSLPLSSTPTLAESISYWCEAAQWPQAFFEMDPRPYMLAKKKSFSSRKRSNDGSVTSSITNAEMTREEKSAPYKDPIYEEQLRRLGFDMRADAAGPNEASLTMIEELLTKDTSVPQQSWFSDDKFYDTCEGIRNRSESKVIRDIGLLIFPSAEGLVRDKYIKITDLIETVDEAWLLTEPITGPKPQPDSAVGFKREAFTEEQLTKIRPLLGDSSTQVSRFRGTSFLYFGFASCEVKRGDGQLEVADRQNAHTMFIAIRAMVHLWQLAGREKDIDRKIMAFSASHDERSVRIYGYYATIGDEIKFYRHQIRAIDIRDQKGAERWTAYKFFKNVYDIWAVNHLSEIRKILDDLPDYSKTRSPSNTQAAASMTSTQRSRTEALDLNDMGVPIEAANEVNPGTPAAASVHEVKGMHSAKSNSGSTTKVSRQRKQR